MGDFDEDYPKRGSSQLLDMVGFCPFSSHRDFASSTQQLFLERAVAVLLRCTPPIYKKYAYLIAGESPDPSVRLPPPSVPMQDNVWGDVRLREASTLSTGVTPR